jgi:hypothetical protein
MTLLSDEERAAVETARFNECMANRSFHLILRNARRICKRKFQRSPNWVLASELFGLGSTYSFRLCRELGIDPEAKTIGEAAPALADEAAR